MKTEYLVIGGLALVAGVFMFKDQICPTVPIPFICDSGIPNSPEAVAKQCAGKCPGGAVNENCVKNCIRDTLGLDEDGNPVKSNYAGYW